MNVMTVILTAAVTLLVCAAAVLAVLYRAEKKRRARDDSDASRWEKAAGALRETQAMVCQGVEAITQKLESIEQALDGEPMDPEARKNLVDGLGNLMSYSIEQALSAARPDFRSDGK